MFGGTMRLRFAAALVAPLVFSMSAALGGNIVLNSNFGSGDFTSWTQSGWGILSDSDTFPGDTFYAETGCVGSGCIDGGTSSGAFLSQVLTTVNGGTYTLSFEFDTQGRGADSPNGAPNELDVLWDGTSVLDLGPGGTLGPIFPFTLYTVSGLVGTGSDTLTFLGRQDPGYNALDNVCVSSDTTCGAVSSGAPEPASMALIGAGLIGLFAVSRFRARA
jgi:hypothetical protein